MMRHAGRNDSRNPCHARIYTYPALKSMELSIVSPKSPRNPLDMNRRRCLSSGRIGEVEVKEYAIAIAGNGIELVQLALL